LFANDDNELCLLLQVRTSTGTFFDKDFDEVVTAVEERVSLVTMLPKANQEGLQVLRYVDGQKYEPHHGERKQLALLQAVGLSADCQVVRCWFEWMDNSTTIPQ
jgi:uncharacterized protein YciW